MIPGVCARKNVIVATVAEPALRLESAARAASNAWGTIPHRKPDRGGVRRDGTARGRLARQNSPIERQTDPHLSVGDF